MSREEIKRKEEELRDLKREAKRIALEEKEAESAKDEAKFRAVLEKVLPKDWTVIKCKNIFQMIDSLNAELYGRSEPQWELQGCAVYREEKLTDNAPLILKMPTGRFLCYSRIPNIQDARWLIVDDYLTQPINHPRDLIMSPLKKDIADQDFLKRYHELNFTPSVVQVTKDVGKAYWSTFHKDCEDDEDGCYPEPATEVV